jgi:hypothetical protein
MECSSIGVAAAVVAAAAAVAVVLHIVEMIPVIAPYQGSIISARSLGARRVNGHGVR